MSFRIKPQIGAELFLCKELDFCTLYIIQEEKMSFLWHKVQSSWHCQVCAGHFAQFSRAEEHKMLGLSPYLLPSEGCKKDFSSVPSIFHHYEEKCKPKQEYDFQYTHLL